MYNTSVVPSAISQFNLSITDSVNGFKHQHGYQRVFKREREKLSFVETTLRAVERSINLKNTLGEYIRGVLLGKNKGGEIQAY